MEGDVGRHIGGEGRVRLFWCEVVIDYLQEVGR